MTITPPARSNPTTNDPYTMKSVDRMNVSKRVHAVVAIIRRPASFTALTLP